MINTEYKYEVSSLWWVWGGGEGPTAGGGLPGTEENRKWNSLRNKWNETLGRSHRCNSAAWNCETLGKTLEALYSFYVKKKQNNLFFWAMFESPSSLLWLSDTQTGILVIDRARWLCLYALWGFPKPLGTILPLCTRGFSGISLFGLHGVGKHLGLVTR